MKKVLLLLALCLSFVSYGQASKATDANGKVIPKTASSAEIKSPEKIVQLFYNNLTDIKAIDPLMSPKFYQKMPIADFQDLLTENNKRLGKLTDRKLVKMQKSDNNNTITYSFTVKYENDKTQEELRLARANEKDAYKIIAYTIIK